MQSLRRRCRIIRTEPRRRVHCICSLKRWAGNPGPSENANSLPPPATTLRALSGRAGEKACAGCREGGVGEGVVMKEGGYKWWRSGCSRYWRFLLDPGGMQRAMRSSESRDNRLLAFLGEIWEVCTSLALTISMLFKVEETVGIQNVGENVALGNLVGWREVTRKHSGRPWRVVSIRLEENIGTIFEAEKSRRVSHSMNRWVDLQVTFRDPRSRGGRKSSARGVQASTSGPANLGKVGSRRCPRAVIDEAS